MANTTTSPQIPQHVSALLSHLTSRPGVQSTLILSRKDGSIIQTTGLLAPSVPTTPKVDRSENSSPAPVVTSTGAGEVTEGDTPGVTGDSTEAGAEAQQSASSTQTQTSTQTSTQTQSQSPSKPYQPSQAEALAAHIFAFVSSASNLSFSLSHPVDEASTKPQSQSQSRSQSNGMLENGLPNGGVNGNGNANDAENELNSEAQDDDEVKLLRLRTKNHEIVVVPDRKYLLCVVQDATPGAADTAGAATRTGPGAAPGGMGMTGTGRFSR